MCLEFEMIFKNYRKLMIQKILKNSVCFALEFDVIEINDLFLRSAKLLLQSEKYLAQILVGKLEKTSSSSCCLQVHSTIKAFKI